MGVPSELFRCERCGAPWMPTCLSCGRIDRPVASGGGHAAPAPTRPAAKGLCRSVTLALALALPCYAAEPDAGIDAPLYVEVQPDGSRLVPAESWVRLGQKMAQCEADRDARWRLTTPQLVLLSAVAVVIGGGVALGVAGAAGRLR